eukprot:516123-Hanusia_phi.AAC.8
MELSHKIRRSFMDPDCDSCKVFYFGVIFGLKYFLGPPPPGSKQQDSPMLKFFLSLHNAILCLLSLVMFLGAAYELVKRSSHEGIEWMFCEKIGTQAKGGLFFWSYIYYLSKYLEFVDTFFKVLKRKPLDFLHVYHHAIVVLMCWNWLEFSQSLQSTSPRPGGSGTSPKGRSFSFKPGQSAVTPAGSSIVRSVRLQFHPCSAFLRPRLLQDPSSEGRRSIHKLLVLLFLPLLPASSFILLILLLLLFLDFILLLSSVVMPGYLGCEGRRAVYFNAAFNFSVSLRRACKGWQKKSKLTHC